MLYNDFSEGSRQVESKMKLVLSWCLAPCFLKLRPATLCYIKYLSTEKSGDRKNLELIVAL